MEEPLSDEQLTRIVLGCVEGMRTKPSWDSLSEVEQTIWYVYVFDLEVINGGLSQFFANPSGDKWPETLRALKKIGAMRIARIFEKALEVFPESRPSTSHMNRDLPELNSEGDNLLEKLSHKYFNLHKKYPNETAYVRMGDYLVRNGW